MVIGAVAQLLEHVVGLGKRCLADPVGTFAAHVGVARHLAIHPERHDVAADPGIGAGAFGQLGGGVVRAAGAEVGKPCRDVFGIVGFLSFANGFEAVLHALGAAAFLGQDTPDLFGDHDGIERHAGREKLFGVQAARAALVPAIDPAAPAVVEDGLLDLDLDQLALFLDHDDQVEPLGPFVEALHVHREGLADLVGREAQPFGFVGIDPEKRQGMDEIQPVLPRRHEADLGAGLAPDPAVDPVGAGEGLCREALVVDHPRFLRDPVIVEPDVEAALRQGVIGRGDKAHPVGTGIDDACHFDRVLHDLEPRPDARIAGQGEAVEAVIQDLLHACGGQNRHVGIDERPVGLVADGGTFAGVVVAHGHEHPAIGRGSGHVRVAHDIA